MGHIRRTGHAGGFSSGRAERTTFSPGQDRLKTGLLIASQTPRGTRLNRGRVIQRNTTRDLSDEPRMEKQVVDLAKCKINRMIKKRERDERFEAKRSERP